MNKQRSSQPQLKYSTEPIKLKKKPFQNGPTFLKAFQPISESIFQIASNPN